MDFKYFFMTILSFILTFVRGEESEAPKALSYPETWSNAKHLNTDLFERQLPITLEGSFLNTIDANRQQSVNFLKSKNNKRKKETLKRRENKHKNMNKCFFRPTKHEESDDGHEDDSD